MPNTLVDPGRGTTMPKAALETDYSKFGKVLFTRIFSGYISSAMSMSVPQCGVL